MALAKIDANALTECFRQSYGRNLGRFTLPWACAAVKPNTIATGAVQSTAPAFVLRDEKGESYASRVSRQSF